MLTSSPGGDHADASDPIDWRAQSGNRRRRGYRDFWWDRATKATTRRTSLIIDPADGRIPALTDAAQARAASLKGIIAGARQEEKEAAPTRTTASRQ
jgi:hypothetical protein